MRYVIIVLALSLCFAGCAHKKFSESLTETQADGTPVTTKTMDSSWVFWPPFSKTGPVAHGLTYTWGGTENKIVSGQDTSDVDTTRQTEALQAVTGMISDVAAKVIMTYLQTPVSTSSPADSASAKITTLAELVKQLQASGLLKGAPK